MKKKRSKKDIFNYENIPVGFYDKIYKKKRGIQSKWHHIHYNLVRKILGKYQKHLDVGCAAGTFVNFLNKDKISYGADISSNQIQYAKKNYENKKHKFYLIKNNKLPFKNKSFDVVTNLQLMEHLSMKDNEVLFKEIKRVLKPGGRLIITTPNYLSPWVLLEKIVNIVGEVKYDQQHITFFNKNRIKNFLYKLNFRNIYVSTNMFFAPFFAVFGWKVPDIVQKFEDNFFNHPFRLFLFVICKR